MEGVDRLFFLQGGSSTGLDLTYGGQCLSKMTDGEVELTLVLAGYYMNIEM